MRAPRPRKFAAVIAALALVPCAPADVVIAQNPAAPQAPAPRSRPGGFRFKISTNLVLVNVVVRDSSGNLVRGLSKDDFQLLEDGKQQTIADFGFEDVDAIALAAQNGPVTAGEAAAPAALPDPQTPEEMRNRRLVILFFDFTAMDPEQIDRSVDAARRFVEKQMTPADLVAIVSLASSMRLDLDLTASKERILRVLAGYSSGQGQGFDAGAEGSAEGGAETGGAFAPDDTDYNTFNTDRKLMALESLMETLGGIQQKKSIVYFSNGISRSGIDNQSALRAATAMAVKTNCSIYPVDIRGLAALPAGGEAQSASLHGVSAYNDQAYQNQFESNASSQETLSTLAGDTGGKAFLDSNDFGLVFQRVQKDTSAYYVLGFYSSNPAQDGRYRRLEVRVKRTGVKMDFRHGYFAPRDFQHFRQEDRERQMADELASDLPETDVTLYIGAAFFRLDPSRFYIPVSLVIPGSQIPFTKGGDKDQATVDVIGVVRDKSGAPFGNVRDTVKLSLDAAQEVRRKNVQYNTAFLLPRGAYHMKFVVRENQTGHMGSFETDLNVPDLTHATFKMSSVVLGNQRIPAAGKKEGPNPLLRDGMELVQNVTHVFRSDQHLYLQFEVYDPGHRKEAAASAAAAATGGASATATGGAAPAAKSHAGSTIRVLTSLEFLQGRKKIYESQPVEATELTDPARKAIIFQIELPLDSFSPGLYTCQVNIVDDAAGSFAFPRTALLIKSPAQSVPQEGQSAPAPATPGRTN
ncbi:MAG TPA: VWA domain-containing protein [Candidatus Binatia bacterium]|nr:VWA domain-containing protein [Candidatus Binatia bacterium]